MTNTNYLVPQTSTPYAVYSKTNYAYIPGTKTLPSSFLPFSRVIPKTARRLESAVFSNDEGLFVYIPLTEAEALALSKVNGQLGLIIQPTRFHPEPTIESDNRSLTELKN